MAVLDVLTRLVEVLFFAGVWWHSLGLLRLRLGEASAGAGFDMSLYPLAVLLGVTATGLFALGDLVTLPWRVLRAVLMGAGGLGAVGALLLSVTGWQPPHLSTTGLLLVGFPVLLLGNAPLAVALGFPALVALQGLGGAHLLMLPQRLIAGVDNFVLLAIPLFLLAGALMETGGISRRLVALALAMVGHLRGGLAHVAVVGEILFSGISGSTTADVAVLGTLLLPAMEREGYKRAEAVAIVSAAAAMGILVPPCLLMVLLATIANLSVTALFLAGFLPAAVLAGVLMLLIALKAWRQRWPVVTRASWGSLGRALRAALLPLLLPVLIFGSIFSGAATVTESAVLAVLYAWLVGGGVYRETPWRSPAAPLPGEWDRQRHQSVAHCWRLRVHLDPGPGASAATRRQYPAHALHAALVLPPREPRDLYGLCGPLRRHPRRDHPGPALLSPRRPDGRERPPFFHSDRRLRRDRSLSPAHGRRVVDRV